ncbi:MAG: tyrosine-type recombinase/integrase [Spirochaetota bacterium]
MNGQRFTLYRRKESGTWYARFRLPDGSWSNPRSTRQYKKRDAIDWCEEYLRTAGQPRRRKRLTFGEFAEITGADIDRALLHIRENAKPKRATKTGQLSNRTVNALHAALSAVFAEAVRQGYVARNPMQEVPRLAAKGERRGILTPPELRELLNPERAAEVWRHPRYWLLFRLAVTTGARSGELRTLHVEDVRPDHILIRRSWDDVEGLTPDTKNGEERTAPLAEGLYNDLVAWGRTTNTIEGYLFPSPKEAGAPIDRDSVMKNYRAALERVGIAREEQRRRNIDFHSLRHAAASLAVAEGVNPWLVRMMTGHKSEQVFAGYAGHAQAADWRALQEWQVRLLGSGSTTAAAPRENDL